MKAFEGLTVLDFSQGIAGPVCAAILGRQGAQVIKIEPPRGDWIRHAGATRAGLSANAVAGNLGKRSLALDVSRPEGRAVALKLAASADVVIENFRPGVMKKLGLDYAALRALRPDLVYCSISGFGASGPLVGKAATDSVVQAWSGMAVANAAADGTPRRVGLFVPDNITALYAAQAVSAALYARAIHGGGAHLELSLAACCAAFQAGPMIDAALFPGARLPVFAPAGEFRCADAWIVVACLDDAMFGRMAAALGKAEWGEDARFAMNDERKPRLREINRMVGDVLAGATAAAWLAKLDAADVLCSAINDYAAAIDDAQMRHMATMQTIEQAPFGNVAVPRMPLEEGVMLPAPGVGEHSRTVLAAAGYDAAAIAGLIGRGVVAAPDI